MEELIKKIMGENYKENMTEDEIIEFMKNYGNDSSNNNEKTVPLEKYTNLEKQLKEIKKQKQEEDKARKEKENADKSLEQKLNEALEENTRIKDEYNKSQIRSVLSDAGLKGDEIDKVLSKVKVESVEEALELGNSLKAILTTSIEEGVKTQLSEQLKKDGKLPDGSGNTEVTKEQFDKMTYSEMMNFEKTNPQQFKQFMGQ